MKGIIDESSRVVDTSCDHGPWTNHVTSHVNKTVRSSTSVALESRNEEETTTSPLPRDDFSALLDTYFQTDSSTNYYKDSNPCPSTATKTSESGKFTDRIDTQMPRSIPTITQQYSSTYESTNSNQSGSSQEVIVEPFASSPTSNINQNNNLPKALHASSTCATPKTFSGLWSFLYSIHQHEQRIFRLLCQTTAGVPHSSPDNPWYSKNLGPYTIQSCMYEYQKLYPPLIEYLQNTTKVMRSWEKGLEECKHGLLSAMMRREDKQMMDTKSCSSSHYWDQWLDTIHQQIHALRVEYDCIARMVEEYPKSMNIVNIPPSPSNISIEQSPSSRSRRIPVSVAETNVILEERDEANRQRVGQTEKYIRAQEEYNDEEEKADKCKRKVYSVFDRPMPMTPPPTPQGMFNPSPRSMSVNPIITTTPTLLMMPSLSDLQTQYGLAHAKDDDNNRRGTNHFLVTTKKSKRIRTEDEIHRLTAPSTNNEETNNQTSIRTTRKRKKKKDKTLPKRPLSAYNLFFCDQRSLLLQEKTVEDEDDIHVTSLSSMTFIPSATVAQPQLQLSHSPSSPIHSSSSLPIVSKRRRVHRKTHGKVSFQEMAKIIGQRWHALSQEEKSVYEKQAQEEKERYFQMKWNYQQQQRMNLSYHHPPDEDKEDDFYNMNHQSTILKRDESGVDDFIIPLDHTSADGYHML